MNNAATSMAAALGLTFVQLLLTAQAYREHKVHNIVLYPDKHSWCKTTTIKQVISYPGCTSIEIDNNVCVGACFSYSIPHTEPSDPGEIIVPYCDSCQPSETTWHQCNKNDVDTPSQLIKHVQIIHNCSCTSCEKNSLGLAKFPEHNEDFNLQQSVDAELLDALQSRRNESNHLEENNHAKKMHSLLHHKLISLLHDIQANNSDYDKEQLFDLFNVMQEPMKHKVKAKNIIDFIETLQSNETDLNTTKLTEILLKFEYSKHTKIEISPIVDMDIDSEDSRDVAAAPEHVASESVGDIDSESDDENSSQKQQRIPLGLWIKNTASSGGSTLNENPEHFNDDSNKSDEKTYKSGGPQTDKDFISTLISNDEHHEKEHEKEKETRMPSLHDQGREQLSDVDSEHHQQLHLHQHHINDNIVSSHGHLARGPHGALVIEPDRIHEEKLDVNAHELKPNHGGTLLSYHSHSGEGNAH